VVHGIVAHSAEHTAGVLASDAEVGRRGRRRAFLSDVADGDAAMGGRGPVEVDAARREGVQITVEASTMRVWRREKGVGIEPAVWVTVRLLA
jgi:hypothetical protein